MNMMIQTLKLLTICILLFITAVHCKAQKGADSGVPYAEIPEYADDYSAGTVASRMLDGLGFRFYWATEGLNKEDFDFRPGEESRSIAETIDHIYIMTIMISNAVNQISEGPEKGIGVEEKRASVLKKIDIVSKKLKSSGDEDFEDFNVIFANGNELPFWNLINGPIADCIWHCGQIVTLRRMSGNPFNSNVSLLNGKLRK